MFAIEIMSQKMTLGHDIFHIVFMVALLSVAFQGTMLPFIAKRMNMIDEDSDVLKTFNDYQEEETMTLMRMYIPKGHNWDCFTCRLPLNPHTWATLPGEVRLGQGSRWGLAA